MSIIKFYREITKFDRELDVIKEIATIQLENELLSGNEKEQLAVATARELVAKHDEHITWLYKDAIKTKALNVLLTGGVIVLGIVAYKK